MFESRLKRIEEPSSRPQVSKNVDDQKPTASTSLKEHYSHESHPDFPFQKPSKLPSINSTPKQATRHPKTKPTYDQKLTVSISS
jgi:hypothetical protein